MSKRKATSNNTRHAKEVLSMEQLRVRHTEMLNASFFRWIQEQHANHRAEFWRNGLEEYLQYGKSIQDKFPITLDSQAAAFSNHSDLAAQPKAKLSRFAPSPSENGKQNPSAFPATGAAAPGFSGTAAAVPLPASPSSPTINFASAPAAAATSSSTLTAPVLAVNKRPELPAFEPTADRDQLQASSSLSSPPSVAPLTSNSISGASSLPFGSPSAFPLLSAEPKAASKASTDAAAASTSASSLFGVAPSFQLPSTSSKLAQPGTQPAFGAAQTQPAFGSSMFPASSSLPAASSMAGQPAATPPFSLPPLSGSSQQPSSAASGSLSFPPWQPSNSQEPASGSQSSWLPAFSFPPAQPGSLPAFTFGSSQPATLPAFSIGSGSAPSSTTASSSNPSTAPVPFQPPTFNFSSSTAPSFGAGLAAPFGFGSSQPAASTSHADAADAQPSSISSFNVNAAPTFGATGASNSAPFSWTAPAASAPTAMPSLGATNGPAGSDGFSFNLPSSTSFGAGGFGSFGGQNGGPSFPQANGTEEEEPQEAEAPTEYAQDEGVVVSQEVKWRHKKDEASWEKTAKGRVLARKSGKGAVYLQFVTTSGQVVSTANIAGELKQHGTTPALLVGVLYVSVRHAHDKAADTWDDPVPKMTLITCSSEASAKDFVTKLSEAKAVAIV